MSNWRYEDDIPAIRQREALADLWERDNVRAQKVALGKRLIAIGTELSLALASDEVVQIKAEIERDVIPELLDLANRLP